MTVAIAAKQETRPGLAPFSLKDAPSFIEAQFPVGRLSAEAYKERKAGAGQTLTALGSYWKGRKPLILVRAVVLGTLLPATDDPAKDLDIFLKLMAMDDGAFARRFDGSATEFARLFPAYAELVTEEAGRRRIWRSDLDERRARGAGRGGVRLLALHASTNGSSTSAGRRNATRRSCSPASGRR